MAPAPTVAPFGSWTSPITSWLVASAAINLADVLLDGGDLYWLEGRPLEAGGQVLVRQHGDGTSVDVTPPHFSARTRVHEYGGGAAVVAGGVAFFSDFRDQRLYRQDAQGGPVPLTPA